MQDYSGIIRPLLSFCGGYLWEKLLRYFSYSIGFLIIFPKGAGISAWAAFTFAGGLSVAATVGTAAGTGLGIASDVIVAKGLREYEEAIARSGFVKNDDLAAL